MKRFISTIAVFALVALAFTNVAWSGSSGRKFVGLWGGVDSSDGSDQTVRISSNDAGEFELVWRESYWSICNGRRGIMQGTGQLDPGDNKTLIVDVVISCFDPDVDVVTDTLTIERADNDLLLVTAANPGVFDELPLFRISTR